MTPDEPAPGDLQRSLDEVEQALRADPAALADLRAVLRHLASTPFDVACAVD